LAVGISFFTFHGISLILDVSRSAEAVATTATGIVVAGREAMRAAFSARSGMLERYCCANPIATRRRPSRRRNRYSASDALPAFPAVPSRPSNQ